MNGSPLDVQKSQKSQFAGYRSKAGDLVSITGKKAEKERRDRRSFAGCVGNYSASALMYLSTMDWTVPSSMSSARASLTAGSRSLFLGKPMA